MGIGDQLEYFHNNGDGTFTRMTEQAGLKGIVGGLNIMQADYDNDGCIDVLVLARRVAPRQGKVAAIAAAQQLQRHLHRRYGEGRAALLSIRRIRRRGPTSTTTAGSTSSSATRSIAPHIDMAGRHQELRVLSQQRRRHLPRGRRPDPGFISKDSSRASIWADYDNDGRPDLYVTTMGGGNHLFRNIGQTPSGIPQFVEVTATSRRRRAAQELHLLVLRLRQRRLARHLRVGLLREPAQHRARVLRPKGAGERRAAQALSQQQGRHVHRCLARSRPRSSCC